MVLYPQSPFSPPVETKVSSVVSADARAYHAALHTAGHLLNWEMRQFGWMAVRGHHFPGESRVEFSAIDASAIPADRLEAAEIERIICQRLQRERKSAVGSRAPPGYARLTNQRLCLVPGHTLMIWQKLAHLTLRR